MPRLNRRGEICGGIGGGYAHAAGRKVAEPAGATAWVTDTVVAYATGHDHDSPWWVETQDLDTGRRARVPNPAAPNSPKQQEANWIEAGGGLGAFGRPEFVWTSDGRTFPGAGLLAVGPDGSVVLRPQYHGTRDIRIVRRDGTTITIPAGPAYDVHMPTPDALVWRDARDLRIKVWGLPQPALAPGALYTPRAIRLPNGEWWLLYQTVEPGRERLVLHPWDDRRGYELSVTYGTARTYRPDAIALDNRTIRYCYARNEGETLESIVVEPADLTKPRVDLSIPYTPPAPPKPPAPQPPKEPTPMPPVATDEIDLSTVTFLHTDIRDWPITSKLTEVELPEPGKLGVLCRHTQAGKWPESQGSEGVLIVVAEIGGRLYAASCEWLRPGQTWKPALGADNIGASTKVAPFARQVGKEWVSTWVPKPGETIGLMVATTGARDKNRHTVAARSQVVRAVWPGAVQQPKPPAPPPVEPPPAPAPTPPVVTDPETRALLQALREELAHVAQELAHVAQRVDARLLEVLETVRAERPLEVDAKVFGTLRGKVGGPTR